MTLSIEDTYKISTSTKSELANLFPDPSDDCTKITEQLTKLKDLKYQATISLTKEPNPINRVKLLSTIEFSSSLIADRQRRKEHLGCQEIAQVKQPSSKKTMYVAIGLMTLGSIAMILYKKRR